MHRLVDILGCRCATKHPAEIESMEHQSITTDTRVLDSDIYSFAGACKSVYYFTVMLVTRPFLIQHLISRLPNMPAYTAGLGITSEHSDLANLVQISIDAAILWYRYGTMFS